LQLAIDKKMIYNLIINIDCHNNLDKSVYQN